MRARISKYRVIHQLISLVIFVFVSLAIGAGENLYANESIHKIGNLKISSFYLRGTIQSRPAAAYMKIHNTGQTSDRLLSASSPVAGIIDFHETHVESGVATMRRLQDIRVNPNSMTVLKPGGLHLMLQELKTPPIAGNEISIRLNFEHSGTIDIKFTFKAFGDMTMGHKHKKGTDHRNH